MPFHPLPLDMFLLFVAQAGAYLYSIFSIVGASMLLLGHGEREDQRAVEHSERATAALRVLVVEVRCGERRRPALALLVKGLIYSLQSNLK